jgi:hypothetical protein
MNSIPDTGRLHSPPPKKKITFLCAGCFLSGAEDFSANNKKTQGFSPSWGAAAVSFLLLQLSNISQII